MRGFYLYLLSVLIKSFRRITISLQNSDGSGYNFEQDFLTSDVGSKMTVDDLKGYIESETGVKSSDQRIHYNSQELIDGSKTLQQCQIPEDSMIGMLVKSKERRSQNTGSNRPNQGPDPETIRLRILGNPAELAQLRASMPDLAAAVQDSKRFREAFEEAGKRQAHLEAQKQRRQYELEADPFNVEAQREIEEIIREAQVMENAENAWVHNPEGMKLMVLPLYSDFTD